MTATVVLDPHVPLRTHLAGTTTASSPVLRLALTPAQRVHRWGTSSLSPFTIGPDREVHELRSGGIVGFVRIGHWALMASDPISPPGRKRETLDDALDLIARLGLRAVFVAVSDPGPYLERGLWSSPIADDALISLRGFSLAGKHMANLRHSVTSARRAGMSVERWSPAVRAEAAAVSTQWLATKRGGEMGFTLGRFDPDEMESLETRVARDCGGRLVGLVTWHTYDNGRGRVLDLMRRVPDAPNPTMDLLIAQSLIDFAAHGGATASLGSVPRSHGRAAEHVYATLSLRRYKDKFSPSWEPRYLVAPSRRAAPSAMLALARAYSPNGLWAACRQNR